MESAAETAAIQIRSWRFYSGGIARHSQHGIRKDNLQPHGPALRAYLSSRFSWLTKQDEVVPESLRSERELQFGHQECDRRRVYRRRLGRPAFVRRVGPDAILSAHIPSIQRSLAGYREAAN